MSWVDNYHDNCSSQWEVQTITQCPGWEGSKSWYKGILSCGPVDSIEFKIVHYYYSQQRPDSAGQGKVRSRHFPVKASSKHCCLLKGLCQNRPLPTPLVLPPRSDPPTHCQGSPWAIQLCGPRRQAPHFSGHRTGLEPGCTRHQEWPCFDDIRQILHISIHNSLIKGHI